MNMPDTTIPLPWLGFYAFCMLSALLWVRSARRFWAVLAVLTVGLLMAAGLVLPAGTAFLGVTVFALYVSSALHRHRYATGLRVVGLLLVFALFAHLLPGFHPYRLIEPVRLSPDASSYARWFSADKAFAGILYLAVIGPTAFFSAEWRRIAFQTLPIAVLTIAAVFGLALSGGFVAFAPKWSPLFVTFALSTLFLTCIVEEVVFRRIIQGELAIWMQGVRYGWAVAIAIGAVLFGAAHLGGGVGYAALATVAGIGYGYAFHRTGRIEAAVFSHVTLNLAHFTFLTYPSLT